VHGERSGWRDGRECGGRRWLLGLPHVRCPSPSRFVVSRACVCAKTPLSEQARSEVGGDGGGRRTRGARLPYARPALRKSATYVGSDGAEGADRRVKRLAGGRQAQLPRPRSPRRSPRRLRPSVSPRSMEECPRCVSLETQLLRAHRRIQELEDEVDDLERGARRAKGGGRLSQAVLAAMGKMCGKASSTSPSSSPPASQSSGEAARQRRTRRRSPREDQPTGEQRRGSGVQSDEEGAEKADESRLQDKSLTRNRGKPQSLDRSTVTTREQRRGSGVQSDEEDDDSAETGGVKPAPKKGRKPARGMDPSPTEAAAKENHGRRCCGCVGELFDRPIVGASDHRRRG
jgi:hypothetical protein